MKCNLCPLGYGYVHARLTAHACHCSSHSALLPIPSIRLMSPAPAACGQELGQGAGTGLGGPAGRVVLGSGESGWIPSLDRPSWPGALNTELTTLAAQYK